MKLLDYIKANTPRSTRPRVSPATVINQGLLNPNQYNKPQADRFKDSLFGMMGIVPGVGDAASVAESADLFNRGENFAGSMAALGALPMIPSLAAVTKGYGVDKALLDRLNKVAPNADAYVSGNDGLLNLQKIVIPKELRGQGEGTRFMNELTSYADETGKTVALSPSSDFGGNKKRLEQFYKQQGFMKNKGKDQDLAISESMIRQPQSKGLLSEIYHGTNPQAAKAIESEGFDLTKSADGTVWFTSNPNIGEVAASGKGGIVKRMLDEKKLKLGGWNEMDKFSVDELIAQGYDGLKLDDGGEITYQIFNPDKLIK